MLSREDGGLHQCTTSIAIALMYISMSLMSLLPVFIIVSENAVAGWDPEQQISIDNDTEEQWHPEIAVEGDKVHTVWMDDKGEPKQPPPISQNYDIYYRYFNGVFWETPQLISDDVYNEDQWNPAIAVEDGEVHIVWYDMLGPETTDTGVYYRHFNGSDWEPKVLIDISSMTILYMEPKIAVEGDNVHIMWTDVVGGGHGVYYRLFDGVNWNPAYEITADIWSEGEHDGALAVNGDEIHVVWTDRRDGDADIVYRHFDGLSWGPEVEISTDVGNEKQWEASIGVDGDRVHVVWQDAGGGDWDIHYRQFDGTTWQPVTEVSTDMGSDEQERPMISVDSTNVHVVWLVGLGGRCGFSSLDCDIYYRYFDGVTWHPEQEIITDVGTEHQLYPAVAADGDLVSVVWQDEVDGDWDIYYRRSIEDISPPDSSVRPISPYWQSTSGFDVSWTAKDRTGLSNISLLYRFSTDNSSWTAWSEWAYDDRISGPFATGSFIFTTPYGEGYYRFYSVATDVLGHVENPPSDYDAACGYDSTPPSSSIDSIIPYWHRSSPLTIASTATDALSGIANVSLIYRFSDDNSTWSAWTLVGVDNTSPWSFDFDFPDGDGHYEFFSMSVDVAGNTEGKTLVAEAIAGYSTAIPSPPSGLNAVLTGIHLENVTLSWMISPDDGAGLDIVSQYDIYRGSIFEYSGSSYVHQATVTAGTSSVTDPNAGEGDTSSYFYRVCAVSASGLPSCGSDQAGKFTRQLTQGPNLISIPLIQSDETTETVLQTVDYDKAWFYDSPSHEWKWYMTSKEYRRDLWKVNHTMGIWVNVTEDSNLTVAGIVPAQTTIHLYEGWNLVSFPSFNSSYTVYDLKMDTGALRLEGYDPSPPYHLRVLGDGELILTGEAYWVRVVADTDWVVEVS